MARLLLTMLASLTGCSVVIDPDKGRLGDSPNSEMDGGSIRDDASSMMDSETPLDAPVTPDSPPPPVDAGCSEGAMRCSTASATTLEVCQAGDWTFVECPFGCIDDSRCAELAPTNVGSLSFDEDAEDFVITATGDREIDTTDCESDRAALQVVSQTDGSELCVAIVHDVFIAQGSTLTIRGERPLVVLASGLVTIEGTVDLSARGPETGPGGFPGGYAGDVIDGSGPSPGFGGSHLGDFDDGGGGGGGLCGSGGTGGLGGTAAGGAGGLALQNYMFEPLTGGSGGGRGRGSFEGDRSNAGFGGAGGGALQISSLGAIAIRGRILASGGGGQPGLRNEGSNWGSGGGGGSGGSLLFESSSIEIGDDAEINVAGGAGASSAGTEGIGESGEDGAEATQRMPEGGNSAGGNYSADGGDAAGGNEPDGQEGEDARRSGANGGGGGGGAGCVLFRTPSGEEPSNAESVNPFDERIVRVDTTRAR